MNNMSFFKGIGIGAVIGAAAGMVMAPKKSKLNLGKALRSMGGMVDSITGAIGL